MSLITPTQRRGQRPSARGGNAKGKGGPSQRRNENNKTYAHPLPITFSPPSPSISILGLNLSLPFLSPIRVHRPTCKGIYDPITQSVWVVDREDAMLLWRRGFFGKGDLSRSEPSWLARQVNAKNDKLHGQLTSEEITALRRLERQQFKADRARAIEAVALEAEAIFQTEGKVTTPALSGPAIPSAATWKPAVPSLPPRRVVFDEINEIDEEEEEEELVDIEHLQLTLAEAFFLSWSLQVLTILHPTTNLPLSPSSIWSLFQSSSPPIELNPPAHFDSPFLIHYVAYHHFRSLGWVVKGGIKFCVDYLLYKRGPVFSHAEFAVVIIPVYEDLEDDPTGGERWTWSWLSTLNRVNTQVQKTLVLAYVTIPSSKRVPLDVLSTPKALSYYSIRQVILKRFVPARMRE